MWQWLLAFFRLDLNAVCRESRKRGLSDFHDFADSTLNVPTHACTHRCKRCNKAFLI